MSKRKKVPDDIETQILIGCGRRCCLCFGLFDDLDEKKGQIAHLDKNASNNAPQNLAFLCLDHHEQYDSRTSQSKGLKIGEVRKYRILLLARIAELRETKKGGFDYATIKKRSLESIPKKTYFPAIVNENAMNNRGIYFLYEGNNYLLPAFMLSDVPVIQEYPDCGADGNDALTWGYSGEGPRLTAYSILRDLYDPGVAKHYYFSFEQLKISKLPRSSNLILTSEMVAEWLKNAPTNDQVFAVYRGLDAKRN